MQNFYHILLATAIAGSVLPILFIYYSIYFIVSKVTSITVEDNNDY